MNESNETVRMKVMELILNQYRQFGSRNKEHVVEEALKHMEDPNLFALALDLGIDTDVALEVC